jgi:hypothetical protein
VIADGLELISEESLLLYPLNLKSDVPHAVFSGPESLLTCFAEVG